MSGWGMAGPGYPAPVQAEESGQSLRQRAEVLQAELDLIRKQLEKLDSGKDQA